MSWGRFLRRRRWHRERAEELDAYLEAEAADNRARGMAPQAARRAAERQLGNRTQILEQIYETNTLVWLESIAQDLRLALRQLRRTPGFTAIVVLILALGIGVNTAMFSVVEAVALRPLPFPQPERLVALLETSRQFPMMSVAYPNYLDWRADNHVFSQLAAVRGSDMILTHVGTPAMVIGRRVTANYFSMLGVKPVLGRTFLPAEDRTGGPDVVVVSWSFWRERLGGDPAWLGRTLDLDGRPRTIVGVMPAGFPGLAAAASQPQFWTPLATYVGHNPGLMVRDAHAGLMVLGRLRGGVSLDQARTDLAAVARALAQQYPKTNAGNGVALRSYLDFVAGDARPTLLALLAAAGLVLLIACANVANLVLARATGQRHADAIRSALGASRARLARAHLAESLCLGAAGGGLGLLLAAAGMRFAPALLPPDLPRASHIAMDGPVLAFTLGLSLLTAVLFGLGPALRRGGALLAQRLQASGRSADPASGGQRLRGALVVGEMALALVLLIGAGLLWRSLMALERVDPGFDADHTLSFIVGLPDANYPHVAQKLAFFRQAMARLAQMPGVQTAGGAYPMAFGGGNWQALFTLVGRPAPAPGHGPVTNLANVCGDYFGAMGIPLLRGRAFAAGDIAAAPPVAIVDEAFARRFWSGPQPLAAALGTQMNVDGVTRTIIGVVGHVKAAGLDDVSGVETYIPQDQSRGNTAALYFVLRTRLDHPSRLAAAAVAEIQAVDSGQPVTDLATMDQRLALSLAPRRATLALMGLYALLALALAAIGIYGVISYATAQRRHEIAIRMALGARNGEVLAMVLAQGLRLAALGVALGLVAALALGPVAASALYGVSWADPVTLLAVPALLLAIAAVACYLPARRAARTDPMQALRQE